MQTANNFVTTALEGEIPGWQEVMINPTLPSPDLISVEYEAGDTCRRVEPHEVPSLCGGFLPDAVCDETSIHDARTRPSPYGDSMAKWTEVLASTKPETIWDKVFRRGRATGRESADLTSANVRRFSFGLREPGPSHNVMIGAAFESRKSDPGEGKELRDMSKNMTS